MDTVSSSPLRTLHDCTDAASIDRFTQGMSPSQKIDIIHLPVFEDMSEMLAYIEDHPYQRGHHRAILIGTPRVIRHDDADNALTCEELDLSGIVFWGTDMFLDVKNDRQVYPSFRRAQLQGTYFVNMSLAYRDFHEANLTDASIRGMSFVETVFTNACLDGADATDSDFTDVVLSQYTSMRGMITVSARAIRITFGYDMSPRMGRGMQFRYTEYSLTNGQYPIFVLRSLGASI